MVVKGFAIDRAMTVKPIERSDKPKIARTATTPVSRLAMEVGFLGWRFVLIRLLSVFFVPIMAGMIAQWLVRVL